MGRKPRGVKVAAAARKPKRVEIKKIENEDERLVCFSKRKSGLFSKANELSTLCGVEVLLVIFSLAGKPYSFGCPTVQPLVDRFLSSPAPSGAAVNGQAPPPPPPPPPHPHPDHHDQEDQDGDQEDDDSGDDNSMIENLNSHLRDLTTRVERGKEKKLVLEKQLRTAIEHNKFARMLMSPTMEESTVDEIAAMLEKVKLNLKQQLNIDENMDAAAASSSSNPPPPPPLPLPPLMPYAMSRSSMQKKEKEKNKNKKKKSPISSADLHLAAGNENESGAGTSSDQTLMIMDFDLNQTPPAEFQINELPAEPEINQLPAEPEINQLPAESGGCSSFDLNKVPSSGNVDDDDVQV